MVRTQIYLAEQQQRALRALAQRTGRTQSELIREAVDRYIEGTEKVDRRVLLRQARGMWRGRTDLPGSANRNWRR
jgi:predicted DNA-binding protein